MNLTNREIHSIFDSLIPYLGDYVAYGSQVKFDCPKCDEGHKKNLECNHIKKMFNCWSCGYKGALKKLFYTYSPNTVIQNKEFFKVDYETLSNSEKKTFELPKEILPFFKDKPIKKYLTETRGIEQGLLISHKVKFLNDDLKDTIIYPFYESGELISACYYNFIRKKYRNLTSLNFVPYKDFIDKNYPVTLTEGVIDSLSSINSIPLLGTTINKETCIFLNGCDVIVALDKKVKPEHLVELLNKLRVNDVTEVELFDLKEYEDMNEYYLSDREGFYNEYKRLFSLFKK